MAYVLRFEENVPLDRCYAEAYQREVHPWALREVAKHGIDELLLGVIVLAEDGDGGYAILDGQHRIAMLRKAGRSVIPRALVIVGLAYPPRALYHVDLQLRRRGSTPWERHVAKVEARLPDAVGLKAAVENAGFVISPTPGPNHVRAVASLEKIYGVGGAAVVERMLSWVMFWPDDTEARLDSDILMGLSSVARNFPLIDDGVIAQVFAANFPQTLLSWAKTKAPMSSRGGRGITRGVSIRVVSEHNRRVPRAQKLPVPRFADRPRARRPAE